ncbi:MAG TPA: (d)CMP kinase [Candidatus Kapabacteria bacterium]|nr:(d)CMP kinase [Candidatus Kapabacteria bacterium]
MDDNTEENAGGRRLVIAIDGPAASGKSTTARNVAHRLGYTYIDTGAMYRAATLAVLRAGIDPSDREAVERIACRTSIRFRRADDGSLDTLLDGEDVSAEIRSPEVTAHVSAVSSYPRIREHLVALQQQMGREGGVVLDGRDIGTVVFPDADVKVFMVADLRARAERRKAELSTQGTDVDLGGLQADLERRDHLDSTRELSPLTKAEDAVEIDTSTMSIEAQVEKVLELVKGKRMG